MSVDDLDGVGVSSDGPGFEVVDRRRLMLAGLAAAAGAGVVASAVEPAAAANGGPVILGAANTATATTQVATSVSGTYALKGVQTAATGSGAGVWGQASKGTGVYGSTNGETYSAVLGRNTSTTDPGGWGVRGVAGTKGVGVRGESSDGSGFGVHGVTLSSPSGIAVLGEATGAQGQLGRTTFLAAGGLSVSSRVGVFGTATTGSAALDNDSTGVYGTASGTSSYGVVGYGGNYGVYASGSTYAGYFSGNVSVSGTLSKGGGSFRIDHPVDPANKFLSHSFVESPDMMNIYNGNVVLDNKGEATVEMPDWFEALNRDFRYQLTPIGEYAPLYISSEMKDGKFSIAGGSKGQKVSWTVTGIRQDAWANAHRIPVEEDKTEKERGKYLHPDVVKGVRNAKALHAGPKVKAPPKATAPLAVPVR